jgi:hypothetical protein
VDLHLVPAAGGPVAVSEFGLSEQEMTPGRRRLPLGGDRHSTQERPPVTTTKQHGRADTERNPMHPKRTAVVVVVAVLLALSACKATTDLDPNPVRTTPAVAPTAPRGGDHQ